MEVKAIMIRMPGPTELLIIFGIILLLFGAKNVPKLAGSLGRGIREFRQAKDEIGISELQETKEELQAFLRI